MILVILTALTAVSASPFRIGNFGLSSGHLSAKTVGGSPSAVVAPLGGSIHGLPAGSYTNDAQGVVVDAVNPGTRTSGLEPTGLGGPRLSYGSTDSKVGDAAFKVSGLGVPTPNTRIAPGFGSFVAERAGDKASGTLKFTTDVGKENYSYGFETDNGISVGENGVAEGGVKAEGGYSYKGDDGKTYSVSYTADHGGFKPQGEHLPTPPPIPKEILISLEKNAKEEAAGHVDDGSYDAQKYNNEGDYSSNGASNNNGVSTIGGGDATSSSSYVSQSNQVHRPTSGVLVGSYKPDSVAIQSSQGLGAGTSGNTQSSFSLGTSQGAQSSSSLPSTDIRFGVQETKSGSSQAQASSGASAYSSAVATGSGSASAFASTGSLNSGFRNEYNPMSNSLGLVGQNTQSSNLVSDSSAGASISAPSTATASASVSGSQTQLSGFEKGSQSANVPSSATASATVSGNQNSFSYANQQANGLNAESNSNAFPSRFGETIDSSSATQFSGAQSIQGSDRPTKVPATELTTPFESNVQPASVPYDQLSTVIPLPAPIPATLVSSTNAGSVDSTYSSSTQKPFLSQQQSVDNSYYYNQPSKPFIIPSGSSNSQQSNNLQPAPISSLSQPDSSSNSGITQAAISPFTSDSSSSSSTQFTSQSSQLGSKPSSQFGESSQQTSTQFGSTETHFGQKPIVQSQTQLGQSSTQSGSSQSSTQENQGTIYHYNKPVTTLSAQENTDTSSNAGQSSLTQSNLQGQPGQIETGSKLEAQQVSSQFGSQTTLQQTQTGSNTQTTQFVQQPAVTSQVTGTNNQQSQVNSLGSQVDQTPQTTQGSTVSSNANAQTSLVSTTNRFSEKPQTSQGAGSTTTFGQTLFGQKPSLTTQTGSTYQLGQFGSGTNFGSKPQTTQSSGFTYSPGQTSQFGKNPISTTQTGSTSQQSQVGTSSFQFGQYSQNTGASVSTIKPIYNRQPIGSLYQQTPVGSTVSPFGFKPQTQGSSFSFSQGQTSLLEKKPVISTTLTGSQFGQNTPSTLGSTTSQTSFGIKPVSQQSQFGTIGSQYYQGQTSQFGKKPAITTQTGILPQQTQFGSFSTTPKPFSQNQFGSPGYQFGYPQTQFGKKPFGTVQFGVTSQHNKFGSSGFQFGQASQSTVGAGSLNSKFGQTSQTTVGAGSVSTTAKPVGSSFSQNQFGSTGSQFGSKPQTSQGSGFTFSQTAGQTSQFEKKPVITTQTGLPPQQSLFGSAGSKFGQSSQSALGAGSVFTTPKPFYTIKPVVSTFTQNRFGSTGTQFGSSSSQFGQSSQSNVGAGLGSTTPKPFSQNQFGSTGFQFGSKPQTSQGSSFTYSQTDGQTSQFGKKPVGTVQFGVTSQQNKLGSSGFQLGQTSQSSVDTGSVNSQSGQTAQSAVGTGSLNTQIGQNAQSNVETVSVNSQIGQTSQSNVGTDLVNSQIGETAQSTEGTGSVNSQIGQTAQSTVGAGLVNSQIGQTAQSTVGAGSVNSQIGQTAQSTVGSGSVNSQIGQTAQSTVGAGLVNSQIGQTLQSTVGAGLVNSQIGQTAQSTVGTGLVNSQIGETSQSTVGTGSVNSQIGQTSQSNVGVGSVSTTTQKPLGSSLSQSQFGSTNFQFGSKPQTSLTGFQFGSQSSVVTTPKPVLAITPVYQQPQFATSGSKLTQGTGSVTTVNKPLFGQTSFGSSWQQAQFGQFGKKPSETGSAIQQTVVGSTDSQKPLTSTVTGVTSTTSQTSYGQKPSSSQFGAPGSVFGLKPQSALQGSSFTSNAGSKGQVVYTTQFGLNGLFQNKGSSSQFGTQLGSGAQFGQKPQTPLGIVGSNTGLTSQSGNKFSGSTFQFGQTNQAKPVQPQFSIQPFGSSQNTQGSTQITSTPSRFGESVQTNVPIVTTISQTAQPTQIGQKPSTTKFGSTFGQFGQKPQAYGSAFATSLGSNVVPFGVTQVSNQVSKYQQTSQFGVNQAANSNVGSGQFAVQAVKPFGSQLTQTTYQQTQNQKLSGSSQGSTFQTGQSVVDQPAQGTGQTISLTGYNYQKPQTGLPLVGGLQIDSQDQKVQQTQSNVNSVVSTTQAPITEQSFEPLEVSSTLGNTQQSQSTVGLSQVGAQPTKPTVITGPVIQTTYNQFSSQPFKPTSTVSTLGSTAQSQASAISTSQFGVQPTAPAATAQFGVQPAGASLGSQNVVGSVPEYTVQPSQGVFLSSSSPSQFSVEPYTPSIASSSEAPSFPNRVGTEEGLFVSNVDAQAIVPVPGFEIVTAEQGSQGVVGLGEIFGGPRDPPKFDNKTGYHY